MGYFHLVFSVPHELIPSIWQNKKMVFTLLFESSAATLLDVAADPKHVGAQIGFLSESCKCPRRLSADHPRVRKNHVQGHGSRNDQKQKKPRIQAAGPLPLGVAVGLDLRAGRDVICSGPDPGPGGSPQKRPKIGLALSGGGARGFAHIGVLKWFEEHRIPVDYIAGTSMGGLVGGLYATGKSPKSMQELVGGLDWDALLRGFPIFQQLSYRRKEDRLYLPGPIVIGLKGGIGLPAGMNAGMEIGLVFDRVTLSYDNVGSFDNLPIPFRCVATDLVAAEPVILKQGSLSRALRATMSLPGMFTPVEIDNRILADGGVLNNVPTDVVKQMGADIVIAVDIGTPLGDKEALNSLFGVLNQTSGVATIENIRRNIRLADLLISPDLEGYTLLDFTSSAAIADLGYKGAEQKALLLQKLSLSEGEWREHLAARQARVLPEAQASPAFVKIEGTESKAGEAITEGLTKLEGKPLDTELLERELRDAWGTGRFDALNYGWIVENGKTGLLIRALEKTYGPPFLDIGLVVNNSSTDDTEVNLLGRLTVL